MVELRHQTHADFPNAVLGPGQLVGNYQSVLFDFDV